MVSSQLSSQSRALARLSGPDAIRFVQGVLSADISEARQGQAIPATLLTVKAKIITEGLTIVRDAETVDLWLPAELADDVAARLERHIIMDQVEVQRPTDVALGMCWGEAPAGAAAEGIEVIACSYPVSGWLLIGSEDALANVTSAELGDEAFASHRIEHGLPAWGHEIRPDVFPPEVGFTLAVSYDKGCFMGQEPLARIHARGQVNRVMVRVDVEGSPDVPAQLDHPDREGAGTLTTVGGGQGLAIVRRTFASPGTSLGGAATVTVTSAALGDDPGVKGKN